MPQEYQYTEVDKASNDLLERVVELNVSHEKAPEEKNTNDGKEHQ